MLCDQICGCAVTSTTLNITGSGTPGDPWVIEQAQYNDITQLQTDVANNTAALAALPGTYVDVVGDTMTGELVLVSAGGRALQVKDTSTGLPFLDFRDVAGNRVGLVQGRTTTDAAPGLRLTADNGDPIRLNVNATDQVVVNTGVALFYKTATNIATVGEELYGSGSIWVTRGDATQNITLNKVSTGATASGTVFMQFWLAGTAIGSITRNAATSAVLYNVSSDANLKTVIGDLDPELAEYVLALVTPMMYSWNEDPDHTPAIGYIAQQVAEAWPESVELGFVTPGVGDVADRTWDEDGNETTPDGVWRPWQMDPKVIIPLLHASLVRTTQKLAYLRAEHDDLIARLEAVEAAVKPK